MRRRLLTFQGLSLSLPKVALTVGLLAGFVLAVHGAPPLNPALERELEYVRMLGDDLRMPDYAELVTLEIEKKFPEARAQIKALKLDQLARQGKFEEAKKLIDAEPDPNAFATWAMKLKLADYYYAWAKYQDAFAIYQAFFSKWASPPAEIASFYIESLYVFGKMQVLLGHEAEAVKAYERLLTLNLDSSTRRNVQYEIAELQVQLALKAPSGSETWTNHLASARTTTEGLLWIQDLWFAKGVVLLAHIRVIQGDISGAQKLIDDYMPQFKQLDDEIKKQGAERGEDLSHLSPVAQCRYLMGVMLHDAAKPLLAQAPGIMNEREKQTVLNMLIGGGKDEKGKPIIGAYQHLLNVFINYPTTFWAPDAATRVDEIEAALLHHKLVTEIKPQISPERLRNVAIQQFQTARTLYNQQQFANAVEFYEAVLGKFPEIIPESVYAVSELTRCYIELWDPANLATAANELYADTTMSYLAERFGTMPGASSAAGNEMSRIISLYGERSQETKRQQAVNLFLKFFPSHPYVATMLLSAAEEAFKAENDDAALELYARLADEYPSSPLSADAMLRMAQIYRKKSDFGKEIVVLERSLARLNAQPRPSQQQITVRSLLSQAYRDHHIPGLRDEDAELVVASNEGLGKAAQLCEEIITMLSPNEISKYQSTADEENRNQLCLENALFGRALCMAMMTLPADKINDYRRTAAQTFEEFVEQFPKSRMAAPALMQVGSLWVMLNDATRGERAFDKLGKDYPEAPEAKLSLFSRAMVLIKIGDRNGGIALLRKMFNAPEAYTDRQMLTVGQELLENAKTLRDEAARTEILDEATRAFDIAQAKGKDNRATQMGTTLGKADILIAKKKFREAVALLEGFLRTYERSVATIDANRKLSLAASEATLTIEDPAERTAMFKKAVDAMKMVRQYLTAPGEIAATDNEIARLYLRRAEAEKKFNNLDGERRFIGEGIGHLIPVLDNADVEKPEIRTHLEESYYIAIPLMLQLGEYRDVRHYATLYIEIFSSGKYSSTIRTWLNEAANNLRNQ